MPGNNCAFAGERGTFQSVVSEMWSGVQNRPQTDSISVNSREIGCVVLRKLARFFWCCLRKKSDHILEKCAAKHRICFGVATDASEQVGFLTVACPADAR